MVKEQIPFSSLVIEKSFKRPGVSIQEIYTIAEDPEVIVRAGNTDEYGSSAHDFYFKEQTDNRNALNRLRDHYGIAVPDFSIVVGGENRFYIVTQRVHGPNLHEKRFKVKEKDEARAKLSCFYSSLADVLIDTCSNGGLMNGDLTLAASGTSGNTQWVYGKRKGDSENQVWLVDLGPSAMEYYPHDSRFFTNQFPPLFEMIVETEKKLSCKFDEARQKIFSYLQAERTTFGNNDRRSQEIDFFLRTKDFFRRI